MPRSLKSHFGSLANFWEDVASAGERVVHLEPNDCYFAHLAVYSFARPFCQDAVVLDAGSGTGYGACYLADHGARSVLGVDVSPRAVAFSRKHFRRPNLRFRVGDLGKLDDLLGSSFDLIFTSNSLEHVENVAGFFRVACQLLSPEGKVLVVVPPITDDWSRRANLANPYHLNIWSVRQWHHVLSQYFGEIQCYRHGFAKPGVTLNLGNRADQTVIHEQDFDFAPIELLDYYRAPSIAAVFVVRNPRAPGELPSPGSPLTFADDSFTRPPNRRAIWINRMRHLKSRLGRLVKSL